MLDFQQKLLEKQTKPKFSKELLNLRRIQDHLARQKDYAEAHKMKLKSDALVRVHPFQMTVIFLAENNL